MLLFLSLDFRNRFFEVQKINCILTVISLILQNYYKHILLDLCFCFRCLCVWKSDCHGIMIMENLLLKFMLFFVQVPGESLFCYRLRRNLSILHFIDHDFFFFFCFNLILGLSLQSWFLMRFFFLLRALTITVLPSLTYLLLR